MKKNLKISAFILALLLSVSVLSGCSEGTGFIQQKEIIALDSLPRFSGEPYVEINGNVPFFKEEEITGESFEYYGDLDIFGRCTGAAASIGKDLMPTEERGNIGMIKPTGWQISKYDFIDGKYLYNRCHLIGFQLTGENANEKNLITGTRYFNVTGMLPFENEVSDYVKRTGKHVMYRVTPIFEGSEMVARGVLMEAYSVEDKGRGVEYCVYVYNVQPNVFIDYKNGNNSLLKDQEDTETESKEASYIINKNTKKFHRPSCKGAKEMKPQNRKKFFGTREELIEKGYDPCKTCNP